MVKRSCGYPAIANDAGSGCWNQDCVDSEDCSFYNVRSSFYWSSSSLVPNPPDAWFIGLTNGGVNAGDKGNDLYVWPVRGGQ